MIFKKMYLKVSINGVALKGYTETEIQNMPSFCGQRVAMKLIINETSFLFCVLIEGYSSQWYEGQNSKVPTQMDGLLCVKVFCFWLSSPLGN